jgi:signal transduction histidine kinase
MTPSPPAGPAGVAGTRGHAWDRGAVFWNAYYAVVLAVTLAIVQTDTGASAAAKVVGSLALLAMGCWYVAYGRGILATGQCFLAPSSVRRAVAFVVAFNAIPVAVPALVVTGASRGQVLTDAVGVAALSIAFSVVFGSWISGIINESKDRAALIEQLEATQAELAAVNREAGVLAERQRLASEIHDTIAQGFTSIVMLIQAAEPEIGRGRGCRTPLPGHCGQDRAGEPGRGQGAGRRADPGAPGIGQP